MELNSSNKNEISSVETESIQRVFHLDRECYIIYTGSGPEDLKPFLRIGNKAHLDEELIANIGNIIVTDWYTGNPVYEQYNIDLEKNHQNCYVGDSIAVNNLINFLKSKGIQTNGFQKKVNIKDRENTAYIYFYKDGNIRAYYKKRLLFDLKEREKKDGHFLQKTVELREILRSNPFRIEKDIIDKQGFILTENNIFLFNHSRLLSCGIKQNFYEELVLSGIDPDLISTVITGNTDDGLFNLLKRKKITSKEINIITDSPEIIESACRMFTFQSDNPLKYSVNTLSQEKSTKSNGFFVKKKQNKREILINPENFPNIIAYGKEDKNEEPGTIFIHPSLDSFTIYLLETSFKIKAYKNCCYVIHSDPPPLKELIEDYLVEPLRDIDTISGKYTSTLNKQIDLFSKEIKMGLSIPHASLRIKKLLKKIGKTGFYIENLAILNTGELIKLLIENEGYKKGFSPKGIKSLKKLMAKIDSFIRKLKGVPEIPLYANVFIGNGKPYIFYSYPSITGFKDGVKAHIQLRNEIQNAKLEDEKKYKKDYQNLINLINNLKKPLPGEKGKPVIKPSEVKSFEKERQKAVKLPPAEITLPEVKGLQLKERFSRIFLKKVAKEKIPEETIPKKKILKKEKLETEREIRGEKTILRAREKRAPEPEKLESKKKTFIISVIIILFAALIIGLLSINRAGNIFKKSSQRIILEEKIKGEAITGGEKASEGFIFHKAEKSRTTEEKITEMVKKEVSEGQVSKTQIPEEHYIIITVKDIFLLTNKIARDNGYKELNNQDEIGKDPNWIYPGNMFKLPDGNIYKVVKGDTLWYISYRYIRKQVDNDYLQIMNILAKIDKNNYDKEYLLTLIEKLKEIKKNSYSENFKKFIDENIEKIYKKI